MSRGFKKQSFSARERKGKKEFDEAEETLKRNMAYAENPDFGLPKKFLPAALATMDKYSSFRRSVLALAKEVYRQKFTQALDPNAFEDERQKITDSKRHIASLMRNMPEELKKVLERPKEDIKKLFRGVSDRTIPEVDEQWVNGKFVYGFTYDKEVAESFKDMGIKGQGYMVTANDIESFEGIVDANRVFKLIEEYNRHAWESEVKKAGGDELDALETYEAEFGLVYDDGIKKYPGAYEEFVKKRLDFQGGADVEQLEKGLYEDEREVFVYGIKFKKSGDKYYAGK